MSEISRDALAKKLFMIMNKDNSRYSDSTWEWMLKMGYCKGYFRIADEIVSKGYKP